MSTDIVVGVLAFLGAGAGAALANLGDTGDVEPDEEVER